MAKTNWEQTGDNGKKYPDDIMESVRQALGLEESDESKDHEIAEMSRSEVFDHVLAWNGIIGYAEEVKQWINDVFNVDLENYEDLYEDEDDDND